MTQIAPGPTRSAHVRPQGRDFGLTFGFHVTVLWLALSLGTFGADRTQEPTEEELARQLAEELGSSESEEKKREPTDPITLAADRSGQNYLQLSLDGLIVAGSSSESDVPGLQLGSHDPTRRGFNLQNVEVVLSGAVDPYFTAQANIVFVESPEGETETEVEELFVTTSSLPANLQVKAGHFFTEFGRLNAQHPHFWDFVDAPLSHVRIMGADPLRASGARISWLMPAPFYSELYLAVQNAFGETLTSFGFEEGQEVFGRPLGKGQVDDLGDLLWVPRYAASFDPTGNQTLLVGASAALGPNATGNDGWTNVYGVDAFWKWKSPNANAGFPFVKVQAERLDRKYRADDAFSPATFEDHGTYAQVVWGFKRGWTAGLRYDEMGGDDGGVVDPLFEDRSRTSINASWYPTEFSKFRLQYNRDDRDAFDDAHSIWLQFEIVLGAHAAHKF